MNLFLKKKEYKSKADTRTASGQKRKQAKKNNENKKAICKSRNGECGNGERGIFKMANL